MSYQVIPVGQHSRVEELARRSYGALPGTTLDFSGASLHATGDLPEIHLGSANVTICNCTLHLSNGVHLVVDGPPQGPWGLLLKHVKIVSENPDDATALSTSALIVKRGCVHLDGCKLRGCYLWAGPSTSVWASQVKIQNASFGVLINSIPNCAYKEDDPPTTVTLSDCAITSAQFAGIAVDRIRVKSRILIQRCTVAGTMQGDGLAVQSCTNAVDCEVHVSEFLENFGSGVFCGDVATVHKASTAPNHAVTIVLRGCVCASNFKAGVNFSKFRRSNPVFSAEQCTFEGNGCTGVFVDDSQRIQLRGCVSRGHARAGLLLPGPGGQVFGEHEILLVENGQQGVGHHHGEDVGQV